MKITAHLSEYHVVVTGHDGKTYKDVDAVVLTSKHSNDNDNYPTIIFFTGKVGFTGGQLERIVNDLRNLEEQQPQL